MLVFSDRLPSETVISLGQNFTVEIFRLTRLYSSSNYLLYSSVESINYAQYLVENKLKFG